MAGTTVLGDFLAFLQDAGNLSQAEIARQAGVSQQWANRVALGRLREPAPEMYRRVAKKFPHLWARFLEEHPEAAQRLANEYHFALVSIPGRGGSPGPELPNQMLQWTDVLFRAWKIQPDLIEGIMQGIEAKLPELEAARHRRPATGAEYSTLSHSGRRTRAKAAKAAWGVSQGTSVAFRQTRKRPYRHEGG